MTHQSGSIRLAQLSLEVVLGCTVFCFWGCAEGPPTPSAPKELAGPAQPAKMSGSAKTHDELIDSDTPNVSKPLELRGYRVGLMTLDEFKKTVAADAAEWFEDPTSPKASATLRDGGMFADKPVKKVSFSFYEGVLLSIHMAPVSSGDTRSFRDHLTEQYGPPDELSPLSVWRDDRATLFLVENRDLLLFDRAIGRKTAADEKAQAKPSH
jgi:hypothetical protein